MENLKPGDLVTIKEFKSRSLIFSHLENNIAICIFNGEVG